MNPGVYCEDSIDKTETGCQSRLASMGRSSLMQGWQGSHRAPGLWEAQHQILFFSFCEVLPHSC